MSYALKATGAFGENVTVVGEFDLAEWIEPERVAAVVLGALKGINDAWHESGGQAMPFADGVTFELSVVYPKDELAPAG